MNTIDNNNFNLKLFKPDKGLFTGFAGSFPIGFEILWEESAKLLIFQTIVKARLLSIINALVLLFQPELT